VLDAAGRVTAIEQQWLFDEFYTVVALDGLKTPADDKDPRLVELARVNLENLRPYGYFTEVRADGAKVTLGTVKEFETALRSGRLWLRFIVPLDRPLDPRKDLVNFSVFDPAYYIEILHLKDDVIAFQGTAANACYGRIMPPKVAVSSSRSPVLVGYSQSPSPWLAYGAPMPPPSLKLHPSHSAMGGQRRLRRTSWRTGRSQYL